MQAFTKYIRAFWKTLRLLMQGGKLPEEAHLPYRRWTERTLALVTTAFAVADKEALSVDKREAIKVKIDGRDMSLQTLLKAIGYHAKEEYAYLLKNLTENSLTTIHATNINDEYALSRFIESQTITSETLGGVLSTLLAHLKQVPNKN